MPSIAMRIFIRIIRTIGKLFPCKSVIRPPGAVVEDKFVKLCIGCGYCIEACKVHGTGVLTFTSLRDGLRIWRTPKLNVARGFCGISIGACTPPYPCTSACPTGALKQISSRVKLGSVVWFPERCIAFRGGECYVCVEVCPLNAISKGSLGPVIDQSRCIGCGHCVCSCPANPKALELRPVGSVRIDDC